MEDRKVWWGLIDRVQLGTVMEHDKLQKDRHVI